MTSTQDYSDFNYYLTILLLITLVIVIRLLISRPRWNLKSLPGPTAYPEAGSASLMATTPPFHFLCNQWADKYGPVLKLNRDSEHHVSNYKMHTICKPNNGVKGSVHCNPENMLILTEAKINKQLFTVFLSPGRNIKNHFGFDYFKRKIKIFNSPKESTLVSHQPGDSETGTLELVLRADMLETRSIEPILGVWIHQAVQRKVHQNICSVMECTSIPALSDKANILCDDGVLKKIVIIPSDIHLPLLHRLISGNVCEQRCSVTITNICEFHHNQEIYLNTDNCRGEIFLKHEASKNLNLETFTSFSDVKNKCVGEILDTHYHLLYYHKQCQVPPGPNTALPYVVQRFLINET